MMKTNKNSGESRPANPIRSIGQTLVAMAALAAALSLTACQTGSGGGSSGTHQMGSHKRPFTMSDERMPGHQH